VDEFLELFDYNAWAMRTLFAAVGALPEDQYHRDLKSSFGGIHGTLAHIVWAEQIWLHRWVGKPNPAVPQGTDLHSLAEVRERWEAVAAERGAFLVTLTNLDETRVVKPSSGGEYVHTFGQMLRHVINHSSYHRGQVVSFIRQLGSKPPDTDLITYYRRKAANRL
jgi:uncharacterized damage-inducible protein DinB